MEDKKIKKNNRKIYAGAIVAGMSLFLMMCAVSEDFREGYIRVGCQLTTLRLWATINTRCKAMYNTMLPKETVITKVKGREVTYAEVVERLIEGEFSASEVSIYLAGESMYGMREEEPYKSSPYTWYLVFYGMKLSSNKYPELNGYTSGAVIFRLKYLILPEIEKIEIICKGKGEYSDIQKYLFNIDSNID